MNTLRLMLRMLARDLRAGEINVLLLALVLAVTALTSVGFLADRVERAVEREAHQLLGGDLLLTADHPWPDAFREEARRLGLRLAESANLLSMVSSAGGVQLAEIKAVSSGYPLRGALRIAPKLKVSDGETASVPESGAVWPDERLSGALGVDGGDSLRVGAFSSAVGAIVTLEPDRGINPFAIAPRLILNLADLPATQLVQPGSRISWRLHLAGEAGIVASYRQWAAARLGAGEKIEGLDNARPEIRAILERAQRFLRLAALLTVVLAAVAVGMAARRYMQRHLDACAVMRCLGASERQILAIHGGEFIVLGLLATLAGGVLGYLAQMGLLALLSGLVKAELPAPGALPWLHGLAVGTVLVVGFVTPPLLRLKSVPTVRVLRREWVAVEPLSMVSYLTGMVCLAGLVVWMAGEIRLGGVVTAGFLGALLLFAGAGWLLLLLTGQVSRRLAAGGWRIGLAGLHRRRGAVLVQIVALSIGLTTLLLLALVRSDLLVAWQTRMPPDAPNRFLINIQPEQRSALTAWLAEAGVPDARLEPMVRGRLVRINDQALTPDAYTDERARRLVEREFNLSARADLPDGNTVVAGRWHARDAVSQFSVEQGLADTLGLKLGDTLVFASAGQHVSGTITSLRKLEWDSMRVNFFVIAPTCVLDGLPTSYITSFYLPADKEAWIGELVRRFPNITVIDVSTLVRQLRTTLDQVINTVQVVFMFALLAGLVVLHAAIETSSQERGHELAVLRALGARRRQLRQVLLAEHAVSGALAGLLSGLAASAFGTVLARRVFQIPYTVDVSWILIGMIAGLTGVVLAGLLAARQAFAGPVIERLRAST